MEKIKLRVTGNRAEVVECPQVITSGTVGLPVEFAFDDSWAGLNRLAIFRAGDVTVTVKDPAVIPWEVLEKPNVWLQIGVYGVNTDGTAVIPTLWASVCVIHTGADPGKESAAEPTRTFWQEMRDEIDTLKSNTVLKEDLDGHIADEANPHGVTAAQVGAAPAGYGLGGNAKWIGSRTDSEGNEIGGWNLAFESGFYSSSFNCPPKGKNHYVGVVISYTGDTGVQIVWEAYPEAGNNTAFIRCFVGYQFGAWEEWSPSSFAPAGYGLGDTISPLGGWNLTGNSGNGYLRNNIDSPDGDWWYGFNIKYDQTIATQLAFKRVFNNEPPVVAIRHRPNYGEALPWSGWEYMNPPMVEGVEYRTTERWDGRAVYKKKVGARIYQRLDGETEWQEVPSPKTVVDRSQIDDYSSITNANFPVEEFYWEKYLDGTAKVYYMGQFPTAYTGDMAYDSLITVEIPFRLLDINISIENYVEDERSSVECLTFESDISETYGENWFDVHIMFENPDDENIDVDNFIDFAITITGRWK